MIFLTSSSCSVQSLFRFVAIILMLFHQTCTANCPPSSCGKIRNISYPFRLKDDPRGCGLRRYEIECVNNVTVLTLFSGKYHVQDINYKKYKIQLTDAGVVEDTACSIPRYFLYWRNFSYIVGPDYSTPDLLTLGGYTVSSSLSSIGVLNCTDPVTDDPRYSKLETNDCDSKGHIYFIFSPFRMMDIKVGCHLKVATFSDWTYERGNLSYSDIHKGLVDGFWLSWLLPVTCRDQCGKGIQCSLNHTTELFECDPQRYCDYVYRTTITCGIASQSFGQKIRGYLNGITIGILSSITSSPKQLSRPVELQSYGGGEFIGRYLASFLAARYLFGVALLLVPLFCKWRRRHRSIYEDIEKFLLYGNLNPIRYEYKEIKKMSGGFKVKLGQGGFGSVYKGKLRSGPDVAIKMLSKSNANGQEFISEVATIGRIHHMNVVRLIGYCVDGQKRALVYEFMPNGSLDKYIFSKEGSIPLSYQKIYEISLGVAHGIAYLHQGCDMQILHFDIKPHNILLDDNFIPKVSDFGLAKLYPINNSTCTLTVARGTLGYMAPELFYKNVGRVSYKADVYSFGMLLMEMASKRRNSNPHAEHSSQHYFPFWIYDQFKEEKDIDMEDASDEDKILLKKMFIGAFWCIQLKPSDRPSINKIVEMLEGELESLEMPPRPSFYPNETFVQEDEISSISNQTTWSDSTSYNSC